MITRIVIGYLLGWSITFALARIARKLGLFDDVYSKIGKQTAEHLYSLETNGIVLHWAARR